VACIAKPEHQGERVTVDSQSESVVEVEAALIVHADAWIQSVIGLLDKASQHLEHSKEVAQSAIEEATSLLQEQVRPRSRTRGRASGGLLAWQVRKVRNYVDVHISGRVLVADLSALVQLSEGHFSRAFKRTFGIAPHAFVLRRRLKLAARLMLESSASLTDIALRCGFTDQAHLCNQFRQVMGESPAAWRRHRRGDMMSV
jgi:AraC family transcriptional regulator